MALRASTRSASSTAGASLTWRATKKMNVRDLSNDDDFLSHLLIEKLGTGIVPLLVHKMDPSRRLPKTSAKELLAIVQGFVTNKGPAHAVIKQAVDELLAIDGVRYYVRSYTPKQVNAFATHASRYFEFYMPSGAIEIAHTSRYSHVTGKSELCILATRALPVGTIITGLKGSMADLTPEEERRLKRGDPRAAGLGVRKDFSVIHSKQKKMNHLFLGPARFVNHDCDNNAELFRDGRYITFRVIKPIALGEEVTTHYGDGYFGSKNKDCLCATCERRSRGGYSTAPREADEMPASEHVSDSESSECSASEEEPAAEVNVNERRTRRGVYHVVPKEELVESDGDDSDEDVVEAVRVASPSVMASPTPEPFITAPHPTIIVPTPPRASSSLTPISSPVSATSSLSTLSGAMSLRPQRSASSRPSPLSSVSSLSTEDPVNSPISSLTSIEVEDETPKASPLKVNTARPVVKTEVTQLPTPPSSERTNDEHDTASPASSPTAPVVGIRSTRSTSRTSSTVVIDKKGKGKASAEPVSVTAIAAVTKEERRALRGRQSLPATHDTPLPLQPKRRGRPPKAETLLRRAQEEARRAAEEAAFEAAQQEADAAGKEDQEREDSGSNDEPEDSREPRALRPRKSLPPKFYDLTKRRAPRRGRHSLGEMKQESEENQPDNESEEEEEAAKEQVEQPVRGRVGRPSGKGKAAASQSVSKSRSDAQPPVEQQDSTPEAEEDDGLKLPKCKTCLNIVPVIKVDGQVVWDGGEESEIECPRCMRHWAIYCCRWPHRLMKHGTSVLPTPREESTPFDAISARKVTRKVLPVLDSKLAAAASATGRRRSRSTQMESEEPPKKRQRVDPVTKVQMSATAKKALASVARSRSGRARVPSLKVRALDQPLKRGPGRPRKYPRPEDLPEKPAPRPRGRPRKRPLSPVAPSEDRSVSRASQAASSRARSSTVNLKALAVGRQPRDGNGRFGKKPETNGIHARKKLLSGRQRALRAVARSRQREGEAEGALEGDLEDDDDGWVTEDEGTSLRMSRAGSKRRAPSEDASVEPPVKRLRGDTADVKVEPSDDEIDRRPTLAPARPSAARRPGMGATRPGLKSVGGLLCRTPNPSFFRRRAARSPLPDTGADWSQRGSNDHVDGSPSDSESASASAGAAMTPADELAPEPAVVIVEQLDVIIQPSVSVSPVSVSSKVAVSARVNTAWKPMWKPSPFNWARKRFSQPVQDVEEEPEVAPSPALPTPVLTYPPSRPYSALDGSPPANFLPLASGSSRVYKPSSYITLLSPPKLVQAGWDIDIDSASDALSD